MVLPTQFHAYPSPVSRAYKSRTHHNSRKSTSRDVPMDETMFVSSQYFPSSTVNGHLSFEQDASEPRNLMRFADDPVDDIFDILCQRVTAAPETELDPLTPRTVSLSGSDSASINPMMGDPHDKWWQSLDPVTCNPTLLRSAIQQSTFEDNEMAQFSIKQEPLEDDTEAAATPCGSSYISPDLESGGSSDECSTAEASVAPPTPPSNPHPDLPPLRALSAYNFFFRDERERLLYGGELNLNSAKCNLLLTQHWTRDRTQKRRHRKTHGKIPFTELSKIVSRKWKELDDNQKDFYRRVSSLDWERYQKELEDYKNRQRLLEEDQEKDEEQDEENEEEEKGEDMMEAEKIVESSPKKRGRGKHVGSKPLFTGSVSNPTEI